MNQTSKISRKRADEYFHKKPENMNCAQAILKAFEKEFNISEQKIAEYKAYGGGRAENGLCGALFSAKKLLSKDEYERLESKFLAEFGSVDCTELKEMQYSCKKIVSFVDGLVDEILLEQKS